MNKRFFFWFCILALATGAAIATWIVVHHRQNPPARSVPDLSRTNPLNQPGGGDIAPEDYEPYSSLYQQQPSDDPLAFAARSFADIPQLNGSCLHPATPEQREMAESFVAANRQSHQWQPLFRMQQAYRVLSDREVQKVESCLDTHFEDPALCGDYRNIRHVRLLGIPGFDRSHTHALVSVNKEFGTHRGSGGIFEVEKTASGWRRTGPANFTRDCSWMY